LLVGQPAQAFDKVVAQEGEEHVAAAIEDRADLEKGQKEGGQTDGNLGGLEQEGWEDSGG
jgi:hypothetical protein